MKRIVASLLIAICLGVVVGYYFAPFVYPKTVGGHEFELVDCAKCHEDKVTELGASDPAHKHATWDCGRCHGAKHPVKAVNCTDCHGDMLANDVHATMYEQGGESPTAASFACQACHTTVPVYVEKVVIRQLNYTLV